MDRNKHIKHKRNDNKECIDYERGRELHGSEYISNTLPANNVIQIRLLIPLFDTIARTVSCTFCDNKLYSEHTVM